MKPQATVESPSSNLPRKGRGFSKEELLAAKFSIKEARAAGLIVDLRRKSKYKENIDKLKDYKKEYENWLVEKEKERIKLRKINAKARKEAALRKKELAVKELEREKEIEEVKSYLNRIKSGRYENIFIVGERGIGKSSFASLISYLAERENFLTMHVFLGQANKLTDIIKYILNALIDSVQSQNLYERIKDLFEKGQYYNPKSGQKDNLC